MSSIARNPAGQALRVECVRRIACQLLRKEAGTESGSSIGARLARGAFWSVAGAAAARLAGLFASMLVARVVGRAVFGQYGMILTTVGMFGTFAGFGLGTMASKYVAEFRTTDPERAGRIITLSEIFAFASGSLMAISLALAAPMLAKGSLASAEMAGPLRLSALSLLLNSLAGAQTGALSGLEAFRATARINMISGMATALMTVAGAMVGGLNGIIWGTILSAALNYVLNYVTIVPLLRQFRIPFPAARAFSDHALLWRFSVPATLGSAVVMPATWLGNMIIVHQANGYAELGLVSAANQWRTAIQFLPATVGTAFLPILSNLVAAGDWGAFRKTSRYTVLFSLAAGALIGIPVFTFAGSVMKGYGSGFGSGGLVLRFTVLAATLYAANNQVSRIFASLGRMWMSAAFDLAWAASFLIAGIYFIRIYSATGFAIALFASAFPISAIQAWCIARFAPSSGPREVCI
jgi:O-antigen/teichoic acid export membrane protein